VSATAFYRGQSLVEFCADSLDMSVTQLIAHRSLDEAKRIRFAKEIKGLKVHFNFLSNSLFACFDRVFQIEIVHAGDTKRRRYRVVNVTRRPAHSTTCVHSRPTVTRQFRPHHARRLGGDVDRAAVL